jgi:hypothetical protein
MTIEVGDIERAVREIVDTTPFIDIHTHLFPATFGDLNLSGIDELLTYHYLEAELFRSCSITPDQYWTLDKAQRADLVWKTLFVENSPISEAACGVIAVLQALRLDASTRVLEPLREFFNKKKSPEYFASVFRLAGVSDVVMTNDPLDPAEAPLWKRGLKSDANFHAALRIDRVLNQWDDHWEELTRQGYRVQADGGGSTTKELRRFIADWIERMRPLYLAVSLPDTFAFPAADRRTSLLRDVVLPACREFGLPMALMIGVRRGVNPALRGAGDAVGRADLRCLENLCREFPENRFLVSVLSRENQHELCVYARKFGNLMPFGCWWFVNNPSMVEEITRERIELLGTSFIPQHSDARVLEQLIYKWRSTRRTIAPVLAKSYQSLAVSGRAVTRPDIQRDVERLFRKNFEKSVPFYSFPNFVQQAPEEIGE